MNELTAYCESLQNCINYIDETVLKKLYFTGEYKSEPKRFYFFLLFNANKRLDAFNELISKIHDKSHYANCAFLILRPILLDLVMMDYISFKSGLNDNKVDEEKLLEYIESIYFDHIKKQLSNLKLYESIKQINDTDYEAKIQTLKTNNSEYFDSNGNKLSHLKKIESAYKMVKCILSESRKDKDYIHLKMALDFYDIYSKYEHTGKYTEKIIAWAYNKDSQHIINELITFPNIIIMDYLGLIIAYFHGEESSIHLEFQKRKNDLLTKGSALHKSTQNSNSD